MFLLYCTTGVSELDLFASIQKLYSNMTLEIDLFHSSVLIFLSVCDVSFCFANSSIFISFVLIGSV